jgi:hypothetical protein
LGGLLQTSNDVLNKVKYIRPGYPGKPRFRNAKTGLALAAAKAASYQRIA